MGHKIYLILFLLAHLGLSTARAQTSPIIDVPLNADDVLVIKGLDLQVTFTKGAGSSLRVTGVDNTSQAGAYRAERKGHQIFIIMNEYDSKRDWKSILAQKSLKRKVIDIRGPSVPVEVHAREGQISFNQWQNKAEVHLVQGKINANQSRDLTFTMQKGEVNLSDMQGSLKARATQGQMTFKNMTADGEVHLQSGQMVLEKAKGNWSINTQNAAVKVLQSQGVLEVENQKGLWTVSKFKGRVDGQLRDGNINISVLEDSDVNLKSAGGKMQIQVPQGAGSYLNLLSAEGDLFLPGDLKANRGGSEKSYRGRLRGDSQKVSVTARSQEGLIILKY